MVWRSHWKSNKEEVVAENGVVTAMQPQAAEAGLAILKQGGNAVDAAVAMGFCNVVLEPYMAVIGGMGYMLVHMAESGQTIGVDFNGRAPRQAHAELFDVLGPAPPGGINVFRTQDDANVSGPLSITVPATCAGFCAVHERFGRLPLAQVLEPAIGLASDGFETNWHTTLYLANRMEALLTDPYLAAMWLPNGRPPRSYPKPAERIIQRDLGHLLRRIARQGAAAMYEGDVAEAIDRWMRQHGGVLTKHDLAAYQPVFGAPLTQHFRDCTIACVETPSGAVTNLETFGILNHLELDGLDHNAAAYLHLVIEAARHAFADRFRYVGDWEHAAVPLRGLLSPAYTQHLAQQIKQEVSTTAIPDQAEPWSYYIDRALHDPWAFDNGRRPDELPMPAIAAEAGHTTHLNVVDKDRNAVSCTHTGVFGPVHPYDTGVYLTGGMAWFIPLPGHPNSIAPWKRPMNNMCPVMVLRNGRPIICQGAPGARRIMHRGVQVLLNMLQHGMGPQDAVAALTVDASGREVLVDSRLPADVVEALRGLGHAVQLVHEEPGMTGNFARPSAVTIDADSGLLRTGVDVFRPSLALGY
ncbi:MAG: gamma-glutamyltransferase family protein [Candidatus Tectomicrobia bacterium]